MCVVAILTQYNLILIENEYDLSESKPLAGAWNFQRQKSMEMPSLSNNIELVYSTVQNSFCLKTKKNGKREIYLKYIVLKQ